MPTSPHRRFFLGLVLALSTGTGLAACNSEVTCKDSCTCQGLAGDKLCITRCTNDRAAATQAAANLGCAAQQEKLATCTADSAVCDSTKLEYTYSATACSEEANAYTKCLGGRATTASSTGSN